MNWQCVILFFMITGSEGSFLIQKLKLNQDRHITKKNYESSRNDGKMKQQNQSSKYKYRSSVPTTNIARATSKHHNPHNTFPRSQYPPKKHHQSTTKSEPARNFSFSYLKGLESTTSKTPKSKINHRKSHHSTSKPAPSFSFIDYYASKSKPSASASTFKSKPKTSPETENFVYTSLTPNQWTEFYFIEPNQLPYSRWSFSVAPLQTCRLQVVDSFCTGDRFKATRLLPTGLQIPLLTTPPVPYNARIAAAIKSGKNYTCAPFTTDPETAWNSSAWSKGQIKLASGDYKLILESILAPYGSGGAFLRLSCR